MSAIAVILGLFLGLFVWLFFNWILLIGSKKPPKIYIQPGFWYPLKYVLIRALLLLRKLQNNLNTRKSRDNTFTTTKRDNAGYGIKAFNSIEEMDKLQELPKLKPLAVDAVYFNGGDEDGKFFVAATARRQDNVVQTLLYIHIPGIGLLELPSLPDTWLTSENSDKEYSAGGLTLKSIKPMELWSLSFDGLLRIAGNSKTVPVKFDLEWRAKSKYFDFDTDLHPHIMADAIAREKWSQEYFDTLKKLHQTHYEQFGEIYGSVSIDGYPEQKIRLQGVRDHSYGNIRDWKNFHRYAINYAYLEDGTCMCVGAISMPVSLSRLVIGYVFKPDGSMSPVASSDFEFYNLGDDGVPPQECQINFVAGGEKYQMVCSVVESSIFYMGHDWDAKIHERMCQYKVNGVPGWGISEWEYRNYDGKEQELKNMHSF